MTTKLALSHFFTPYTFSGGANPAAGSTPSTAAEFVKYLTPGGTVGSAAFGGMLRDAPIGRGPTTVPNWSDLDMETEVRNAKASGLDGFTVDILNTGYGQNFHWLMQESLLRAAAAVGNFIIVPMFDMGPWHDQSPASMAARMKTLASFSSCFTLPAPDGRLVLSAFNAERFDYGGNTAPANWATAIAAMESTIGKKIAFVPCFLNYPANIGPFMSGVVVGGTSRMYGGSSWGNRSPAGQSLEASHAADAHGRGLIWMQAVSVQDERPKDGIYDEAVNTQNLEYSWAAASGYSGGFGGTFVPGGVADWTQGTTWNDFSEGTAFAPSVNHGWSFATLSAWYCSLWKAGLTPSTAPTPGQDTLVLTHRTRRQDAATTGSQTKLMARRAGTSAASDQVELLCLLSASSQVSLNIGGTATSPVTKPAGLSRITAPLASGPIFGIRTRSGVPDLKVQTPLPALTPITTAVIQDEEYIGAIAQSAASSAATILFGVTDSALPSGMLDTLEGAWSSGTGTGISNRIPATTVPDTWLQAMAAFGTGTRELALHQAGHNLCVTVGLPSGANPNADIANGTYDAALTALGARINSLAFGAAVSGAQPGAAYNGLTATVIRIAFDPQMDTDTAHGAVAQQNAAWRHFCATVAAPLTDRTRVKFVWAPSGGAAANGKATIGLPGLTAADYVDEIGVQFPVPSTGYTHFASDIQPWKTWLAANTPNRKFFIVKMAVHVDPADSTHQGIYLGETVIELENNTGLYSGLVWDALPSGALDDRNPAKSNNPSLFTAFHDAVAAAVSFGGKPIDTTPPAIPTALSAPTITSTGDILTWMNPPDADFAGVQLYRNGVFLISLAAPIATFADSVRAPGSTDFYSLAAFDNATPPNVSVQSAPLAVVHPTGAVGPPSITSATIDVEGATVVVTAAAFDPASGALAYSWDWGDGSDPDAGTTASHTYASPGTYQIVLTVTSSVSGLPGIQTLTAVVGQDPNFVTDIGLIDPVPGTRVGLFGPALRSNNALLTELLLQLLNTEIQVNDTVISTVLPVISYQGGISAAVEAPSGAYPAGRIIVSGATTGLYTSTYGGTY